MTMDASFEAVAAQIRSRFGQPGFITFMGSELEELSPGSCVVGIKKRPEVLQHRGFIHGGAIAFLVDTATTLAAMSMIRPPLVALTAEFKLNYLSPAVGDHIFCRAKVVKAGKTLSVVTADVFSQKGSEEKMVATALASIAIVDGAKLK